MLLQERGHFEVFNRLIAENQIRPTVLHPAWNVAGYVLGAGTALMGKNAAMMCTEAVETVIGQHYNDQLREIIAMEAQSADTGKEEWKQLKEVRCCRGCGFGFAVLLTHSLAHPLTYTHSLTPTHLHPLTPSLAIVSSGSKSFAMKKWSTWSTRWRTTHRRYGWVDVWADVWVDVWGRMRWLKQTRSHTCCFCVRRRRCTDF